MKKKYSHIDCILSQINYYKFIKMVGNYIFNLHTFQKVKKIFSVATTHETVFFYTTFFHKVVKRRRKKMHA